MQIYLSAPAVLCCAGENRAAFFDASVRGDQSGIQPVTAAGGRRFLAGRINSPLPEKAPGMEAFPAEYAANTRIFRVTASALGQIRPVMEKAVAAYGGGRIGVCLGSCDNGSEASTIAHKAYFAGGAFPEKYDLRFQAPSLLAEYTGEFFGVTGPAITIATACSSSAAAIIRAAEFIRAGYCDAVISGGADIASDTAILGFASLEAVSDTITNPFSKNRKGITLGDGAAFFVLSRDPLSPEKILLLGSGESADAYHMTSPREDGAGAVASMRASLSGAGLKPEDIDYINLHGTGTLLNDRMEAFAVKEVFSGPGGKLPLASSTKPVTGHTLGAAGALELALCWMVLARKPPAESAAALETAAASKPGAALAPMHCWDGEYDETLPPLRFAGKENSFPVGYVPRFCMSNSFAFGGSNVSLIIGSL